MYLTSLIHRERLFEVAARWFAGEVRPDDGRFLTEVFAYEAMISGPPVRLFLIEVLEQLHGTRPRFRRVCVKDDLRQAIISGCRPPTRRAEELFRRYREMPEEFFPRTPVDLVLAHGPGGELLGMSRIKRIRRIAEKASRRVADRLAGAINWHARALAVRRAQRAGLTVDQLISSPETMSAEFAAAERLVALAFRDHKLEFEPGDLRIDDVIGLKIIVTPDQLARVPEMLDERSGVRVIEREEHSGTYNATNLIVEFRLPSPEQIARWVNGRGWSFVADRGLDPAQMAAEFPAYVESGAHTIHAEVILTTYDELVESEFGRSIHENRILEQRASAPYSGRIANNASYIIEYMLMLAISPRVEVDDLPVRMWGHYLPDTLSTAIWNLFNVNQSETLCDVLTLVPDEVYEVLSGVYP
ncbi:MAG: hypothetical protein FJY75_10565 [Candidatus Eisenbacteria bacterium]|uniref:Uncharacterized protein n=1 Tax=Eiseniibacteriota bacterium TaxID=2212470 RepID=A0A937XCX9_UNCEI|nr:hypothetical protein [Candidatus Eisenbacteria bacterium]